MKLAATIVALVLAFAACTGSNAPKGEGSWTDANGKVLPDFEQPGPAHCDWERIRFIYYAGRLFVQDRQQRFGDSTPVRYTEDAELPADAKATGITQGSRELWIAKSERDAKRGLNGIYIVQGGRAQRWPRMDSRCQ